MKKFNFKNVSFEWAYDLKKEIQSSFDKDQLKREVDKIIENDIKGTIQKGISPVYGVRAFQKYKNPKQYPAGLKQSNKPNLTLTGEMLSHYKSKPIDNFSISVGIHKDTDKKTQDKAKANNEGTQGSRGTKLLSAKSNKQRGELAAIKRKAASKLIQATKGIPARPFVPKNGQEFNKSITAKVKKAFADLLNKAIKGKK